MKTLTLQITPWRDLSVWRRVELTEEETLHDLHLAIQDAFELDDDHLYAFFLNDHAWDKMFEYAGPGASGSRRADHAALGALPLRRNKRILYIFDFGAELRHEVRVVGEGIAEEGVRYPRLVEANGTAPPQYPRFDEGSRDASPCLDHRHEGAERGANPALLELVPVLREHLDAYEARADPAGERLALEPTALQLRRELESALALLDRSGGDRAAIHLGVEHALERDVWRWLTDLPLELSRGGLHEEAVALATRVRPVWMSRHLDCDMPVLLARAGRREDALLGVEANLDAHPDDPTMLLASGVALRQLGEEARAEECLRSGLAWVGTDLDLRDDLVHELVELLGAAGREEELQALVRAEQELQGRLRRDRMQELGLVGPAPVHRATPKVGRNEPCPCGSGKKYKKCCGAVA